MKKVILFLSLVVFFMSCGGGGETTTSTTTEQTDVAKMYGHAIYYSENYEEYIANSSGRANTMALFDHGFSYSRELFEKALDKGIDTFILRFDYDPTIERMESVRAVIEGLQKHIIVFLWDEPNGVNLISINELVEKNKMIKEILGPDVRTWINFVPPSSGSQYEIDPLLLTIADIHSIDPYICTEKGVKKTITERVVVFKKLSPKPLFIVGKDFYFQGDIDECLPSKQITDETIAVAMEQEVGLLWWLYDEAHPTAVGVRGVKNFPEVLEYQIQ